MSDDREELRRLVEGGTAGPFTFSREKVKSLLDALDRAEADAAAARAENEKLRDRLEASMLVNDAIKNGCGSGVVDIIGVISKETVANRAAVAELAGLRQRVEAAEKRASFVSAANNEAYRRGFNNAMAQVRAALAADGPEPAEVTHVVVDASDDPEHADDCPGCMVRHTLTEYGTTNCPVEGVRALVDDGECSACGGPVQATTEGCESCEGTGRVECWNPGGPCPVPNAPGCETCGPCNACGATTEERKP